MKQRPRIYYTCAAPAARTRRARWKRSSKVLAARTAWGLGGGDGDHGGDDGYPREHHDDPNEHLEIERRRFRGGLPPTPVRYALAREHWYRLTGALVRPPMDSPVGTPSLGSAPPKHG
ncbi:hypothetical protein AWB81_07903 [Caballeronia arationis]|jgi:hypothetical protein|uniref:Uncharacterized protein n=1 Tax=Caballeronia arationis TaxID=1777142 RepID=A0A7Z7I3B3_9BURK|nr:hypothetical protein [Caballeronia arationis]SAL07097.1 hypothetical protein AWB81_07903 [Caballeronia arationis]SOE56139.1 hypothetical protein SAMN05446927_1179 [Caballeronia arationis]